MVTRAVLLHLRWFALFAFVALTSVVLTQVQNRDAGTLIDLQYWLGLSPTLLACAGLAIAVPWAVFAVDPRRTEAVTLAGMLRYWKAL